MLKYLFFNEIFLKMYKKIITEESTFYLKYGIILHTSNFIYLSIDIIKIYIFLKTRKILNETIHVQ